jgi:hypothetical protein
MNFAAISSILCRLLLELWLLLLLTRLLHNSWSKRVAIAISAVRMMGGYHTRCLGRHNTWMRLHDVAVVEVSRRISWLAYSNSDSVCVAIGRRSIFSATHTPIVMKVLICHEVIVRVCNDMLDLFRSALECDLSSVVFLVGYSAISMIRVVKITWLLVMVILVGLLGSLDAP